jgi:Fe-S oxidoreductase
MNEDINKRCDREAASAEKGCKMNKSSKHSEEMKKNGNLQNTLKLMEDQCTGCKICLRDCSFLKKFGTPGKIATGMLTGESDLRSSFQCSLCGLCASVCPEQLDPSGMFLDMRREAVEWGEGYFPEHNRLVSYEKRGNSRFFNYYLLPENSDTVFFPGCTLPGTRPDKTFRIYQHLREHIPSVGIVLDCCNKPSHDLGRDDYFHFMFDEMKEYLTGNGIRNIITACPSCNKIFDLYGGDLKTVTLYDILNRHPLGGEARRKGEVFIHDPCATRFNDEIHDSVRKVIEKNGYTVVEHKESREKTLCCGEGGASGFIAPELSDSWRESRKENADGRCTITYCAGCVGYLKKETPVSHLVDLLFEPDRAIAGKPKVSMSPFTYINRLLLKRKLKKESGSSSSRERDLRYPGDPVKKKNIKSHASE